MVKWLFALVMVFVIGFLGYWILQKLQTGPNDSPNTTLELTSSNLSPHTGNPFDVSVNISTNQNIVSEVLVEIEISPEIVEVDSVKSGGDFEIDENSVRIRPGEVTFRAKSKTSEFSGTGSVSTLNLRGISGGTMSLCYTDRTIVGAATPLGENVLLSTKPITISIVDN